MKESQIKKEINHLENKNADYNRDSKINYKNEQNELLPNRLKTEKFNKNQKVIFNLIYRASKDGDSPHDYTICVIKTTKGVYL